MNISWKSNMIECGDYKFKINELKKIEEIHITLKNVNITFLGIQKGLNDWAFCYDDLEGYERLISLMAEEEDETAEFLRKYARVYGAEHVLWETLVCTSKRVFNWRFSYDVKRIFEDFYDSRILYEIIHISFEDYKYWASFLPEKMEVTLNNKYLNIRQEDCSGLSISDTDYCDLLQNANLFLEGRMISIGIEYLENRIRLKEIDEEWGIQRNNLLRHKMELIIKVYEKQLTEELEEEYGAIKDIKTDLLDIINGLNFKDALSIYHLYNDTIQELEKNKKESIFAGALDPYDRYIDFFQHASIFVSNYLNKINKYKSKRVFIPKRKIDEAFKYMYNACTVEEAYELMQQKDYIENRRLGDKGEAEVNYALKWLIGDFMRVKRTPCGRYGEQAIVLNNTELMDEPQEFDHIVIGTQGIFNIETKNYVGKLIIDTYGNWIRIKADGSELGERNPIQQIRRHEAVLKSIVGENIPIINVLVMANPKIIIEGVENFPILLLKADRLEEYISTYRNDKNIEIDIADIYNRIEQYRVSK